MFWFSKRYRKGKLVAKVLLCELKELTKNDFMFSQGVVFTPPLFVKNFIQQECKKKTMVVQYENSYISFHLQDNIIRAFIYEYCSPNPDEEVW